MIKFNTSLYFLLCKLGQKMWELSVIQKLTKYDM